MEIKEMNIDELEARIAEIKELVDSEDADLDALEAEARAIDERKMELKKIAEDEAEERKQALEEGEIVKEFEEEGVKTMDVKEIRESAEYLNAYVDFIKSGKDEECRALLTENVSGTVPVPTYVEGRVRTAWEKAGILDLVRKTYIKGNLKIGFEISGDGAYIHSEGDDPIDPENLTLGIVTLVPESVKKLVQISDEAMDMGGEEFIDYIIDEIVYKIAMAIESDLIDKIATAPTTATSTSPAVGEVADTLGVGTVATALGLLSPEAANPVVVTTRSNWAAIKTAAYGANYAVDPFEGLPVYFVPAAAMAGAELIVGDFGYGAHANFANGADIDIKVDDRTNMAADLVNILGRQYVATGIVAMNAFVRVVAASE